MLKFNEWETDRSMEKLASGMRINRAGDDPSGLAVSEKMRSQIHGLRQAERNTEDGMSLIQTSEGYLTQLTDIIQRIRVLGVQSSNGVYSDEDRQLVQVEVSQLVGEVDRIASQAEFNRFDLFRGRFASKSRVGSMWFHIGPNANQRVRAYIGTMTARSLGFKRADGGILSISSPALSNTSISVVDVALGKIMKQRADLGAYYSRLEHTAKGLMEAYENVQASESRVRDADMAEELVRFTTHKLLSETSIAMLAQANVRPQAVLSLLK
jgi:flagellin